jgi:endo-1,4-beta-xylanase
MKSVFILSLLMMSACGGSNADNHETDAPETDVPETDAPDTDTPGTDTLDTETLETDTPVDTAPDSETEVVDLTGLTDADPLQYNLSAVFADGFDLGVAVEPYQLSNIGLLVASNFTRMTAENAMKFGRIHPMEESFDFDDADQIADFARATDMKMTGHALIWHQQVPAWFTALQDRDAAEAAMKEHIDTLVARYADVVDNWDVVNEAISDYPSSIDSDPPSDGDAGVSADADAGESSDSDSTPTIYRTGAEGAFLYDIFGKEYIRLAFELADQAVVESGQEIDLYYNDYDVVINSEKRARILEMARWLQDEGVRIDGIGMQGHWNIEEPSPEAVQTAIDEITAEGLKVKISEMDISLYTDDEQTEVEFTKELEELQAERYLGLFEVFRTNAENITSVTLWGVADDHTWLDNYPVQDRKNYPLLFDVNHDDKAAYRALLSLATPDVIKDATRPRAVSNRFIDGMLNPKYLPDYSEEDHTITEPGVNLLYDPGFEAGVGWWQTFGSVTLLHESSDSHAGDFCLKAAARKTNWAGPSYSIVDYVLQGAEYVGSAWVKSASSTQNFTMTLRTLCEGESETVYVHPVLDQPVGEEWTNITGTFLTPECKMTSASVYIEGPAEGIDFFVDDVSVMLTGSKDTDTDTDDADAGLTDK